MSSTQSVYSSEAVAIDALRKIATVQPDFSLGVGLVWKDETPEQFCKRLKQIAVAALGEIAASKSSVKANEDPTNKG